MLTSMSKDNEALIHNNLIWALRGLWTRLGQYEDRGHPVYHITSSHSKKSHSQKSQKQIAILI
jgi:hypothetical protein